VHASLLTCSAFKDAGIEVDKRSEIMTNNIFEKGISLPHAYTYIVQMIPSCEAGDLNSVLHGLGSMTTSATRGGGGAAKMNGLATHQEAKSTYFRQDHTAAFQSGKWTPIVSLGSRETILHRPRIDWMFMYSLYYYYYCRMLWISLLFQVVII